MKKVLKKLLKAFIYLIVAMLVWVVIGIVALAANEKLNDHVRVKNYTVRDENIPKEFDGYKIMAVSDLHAAPFGDQIIAHADKQKPDLLVFTGDMTQLPDYNIQETVKIGEAVSDIPKYYVSGNHERQTDQYYEILNVLPLGGITPLENDKVTLERDGAEILLMGVKDPKNDVVTEDRIEKMQNAIGSMLEDNDKYSILLNHRADLYPELKDCGEDLILSGHLHGGIIRLPFMGGLISGEGLTEFFPEYDYGRFKEGDSAEMIVNGGCDKNPSKKRFFNPPEVVCITLESE